MTNAVNYLAGVVDGAVVGAQLDDSEAERTLRILLLGVDLGDALAQVILFEAVRIDATDQAEGVTAGL